MLHMLCYVRYDVGSRASQNKFCLLAVGGDLSATTPGTGSLIQSQGSTIFHKYIGWEGGAMGGDIIW
jgi:hypothetical protein